MKGHTPVTVVFYHCIGKPNQRIVFLLDMIQFNSVNMQYQDGHVALKNINLYLEKGSMAFITGRSGAGKTSLLRLIALVERHYRGQIIINGQNLSRIKKKFVPYYRRSIGFIWQDHNLLCDRTVFDNVALPLIVSGKSHTETSKRVRAVLDKVGLLSKEKANPMTLSAGEQQRVGIARAIVHRPILLLADEPTGNLDPALSLDTMRLFERFNQFGTTVLIASHDLNIIEKIHKRIIILREGRIATHFGDTTH